MNRTRLRRLVAVLLVCVGVAIFIITHPANYQPTGPTAAPSTNQGADLALTALNQLAIKGRAPKTGYTRDQFGSGWGEIGSCDTRNVILQRDLTDTKLSDCFVLTGTLHDPYTGQTVSFKRGAGSSSAVQIDHVVALSDAWQKGAQGFSAKQRQQLANDPLNLLAVDGPTNSKKGDSDAASWLPPNKAFRCEYAARQIAVKQKYSLWVTQAEHDTLARTLASCPNQKVLK
jgi:hypothetical protein